VDAILCRDCMVHLSYRLNHVGIENIRRAGIKYLLASTFPGQSEKNRDPLTGGWRPLDLSMPPFEFPPLRMVSEGNLAWRSKHLALWRVSDLPRLWRT